MVAVSRAPRRLLDRRQRGAGAGGDLAGRRVDGRHVAQAQQAEHDLATPRHGAAHEAGVAALRHDADPRARAGAQHRGDLRGRRRSDDGQRRPAEAARPVGLVAGAQVGIGQTVVVADDRAQLGEEVFVRHATHASGTRLTLGPRRRRPASWWM
jgi:hypothetical protein